MRRAIVDDPARRFRGHVLLGKLVPQQPERRNHVDVTLREPCVNILRASLHPEGLATLTENFGDWARYLLRTLHRSVIFDAAPGLAELEREVAAYPTVQALQASPAQAAAGEPFFLVPCILNLPLGRVSMLTTLTTFGTARDVAFEELCVELFYPADEQSEVLLHGLQGQATLRLRPDPTPHDTRAERAPRRQPAERFRLRRR